MKRVDAERSKERRVRLNALRGQDKGFTASIENMKEQLYEEPDKQFQEMYKGDLLKKEAQQEEVRAEIEKLEKAIVAEKAAGVLMPEFLELMDKIAQIIASTDAMPELDFCIKKLFSNFSVSKKNVENATLCEPFVGLIDPKGVMGAR